MKKLLHLIHSFFRRIFASARRSSVHVHALSIIVICGVIIGAFIFATRQSDKTFDTEYAVYNDLAAQADNSAYIPGAVTNPIRVALDRDLTEVLDQSNAAPKRLAFATQGLADLKYSENQIGDISSTTAKVDAQIAIMQVNNVDNAAPNEKARSIIALAKTRSSIISDIRAYSYRTDFEISQIFSTIITDKGVLTNDYVISLNNEIPTVETEFNQRSNLYTQLQNTAQKIAQTYAGTSPTAPGAVTH
jgi:hypothetical protein